MVNENVDELNAQGSESAEGISTPSESGSSLDGYVPISKMHESNAVTRKKSYERGYQKGIEEARSGFESNQNQHVAQQPQQTENLGRSQLNDLLKEEAQKIVQQQQMEAQQRQLEDWGRAVEADFLAKSEKLKTENPDFDGKAIVQQAASLAPFAFAHSAQMENSPEVWQHLLKENPVQLSALEDMVKSNDAMKQQIALAEIKKVSDRLKQNRVAKDADAPPTPVDRINETTHGVGRSGKPGMDYFRNLHSRRR